MALPALFLYRVLIKEGENIRWPGSINVYLNVKEFINQNNSVCIISHKIPQPLKIGKPSESFPKRGVLKLETIQLSMEALFCSVCTTVVNFYFLRCITIDFGPQRVTVKCSKMSWPPPLGESSIQSKSDTVFQGADGRVF